MIETVKVVVSNSRKKKGNSRTHREEKCVLMSPHKVNPRVSRGHLYGKSQRKTTALGVAGILSYLYDPETCTHDANSIAFAETIAG